MKLSAKRIVSALLAVLIMLSTFAVSVSAEPVENHGVNTVFYRVYAQQVGSTNPENTSASKIDYWNSISLKLTMKDRSDGTARTVNVDTSGWKNHLSGDNYKEAYLIAKGSSSTEVLTGAQIDFNWGELSGNTFYLATWVQFSSNGSTWVDWDNWNNGGKQKKAVTTCTGTTGTSFGKANATVRVSCDISSVIDTPYTVTYNDGTRNVFSETRYFLERFFPTKNDAFGQTLGGTWKSSVHGVSKSSRFSDISCYSFPEDSVITYYSSTLDGTELPVYWRLVVTTTGNTNVDKFNNVYFKMYGKYRSDYGTHSAGEQTYWTATPVYANISDFYNTVVYEKSSSQLIPCSLEMHANVDFNVYVKTFKITAKLEYRFRPDDNWNEWSTYTMYDQNEQVKINTNSDLKVTRTIGMYDASVTYHTFTYILDDENIGTQQVKWGTYFFPRIPEEGDKTQSKWAVLSSANKAAKVAIWNTAKATLDDGTSVTYYTPGYVQPMDFNSDRYLRGYTGVKIIRAITDEDSASGAAFYGQDFDGCVLLDSKGSRAETYFSKKVTQYPADYSNRSISNPDSFLKKTGYHVASYNTETDGTGTRLYGTPTSYTYNDIASLANEKGEVVVYPEWEINTYPVTYNKNCAAEVTNMPDNTEKTHDVTFQITSLIPERTGYVFLYWNQKADGSGEYAWRNDWATNGITVGEDNTLPNGKTKATYSTTNSSKAFFAQWEAPEFIAEVPATTTATGKAAHYKDSLGRLWTDENSDGVFEPVTGDSLIIEKLEENMTYVAVQPAMINTDGVKEHYVNDNGDKFILNGDEYVPVTDSELRIPKLSDSFVFVEGKDPEINEDGYIAHYTGDIDNDSVKEYYLRNGEDFVPADYNTEIRIPMLSEGFAYIPELSATINADGVKAHFEDTIGNKFIRTADGYVPATDEELRIPKLSESFRFVPGKEATVNEDGYIAHYTGDVDKDGEKEGYLKNGDTYVPADFDTQIRIPKLSDSFIRHERTEATDTSDGTKEYYTDPESGDRYVKNSSGRFDKVTAPDTLVLHYLLTEKTNVVAPTCSSEGSYNETVYCANCGKVISRKHVTVPAVKHTDEDTDGYCDLCGAETGWHCSRCAWYNERKDVGGLVGFIYRIIHEITHLVQGINHLT